MASVKTMDLDAALQDLGQFGKFQVYYFTLLLFPVLLSGFRVTEYVFTTMNIPHRCRIPECENGTEPNFSPPWLSSAIPEGLDHSPLPCLRYQPRYPPDGTLYNSSCSADLFTNVTESCDSWVFADPVRIIAEDFHILCPGDYWKLTFLSSISVFTGFIGEPLTGVVSDRIGRKGVLVYGSIFICVAGLLRSISFNYVMLAILEGIDGLICGALFSPAFLLGLETLSPKKRLLGSMLINVYWPVGEMTLGFTMWLVQDWRIMQRVFYIPMLVISILLHWNGVKTRRKY